MTLQQLHQVITIAESRSMNEASRKLFVSQPMVSAVTVLALVIALYEKEVFGNVNIALLRLPVFIAGCFYGRSSYEKRESYWKWLILLRYPAICSPCFQVDLLFLQGM